MTGQSAGLTVLLNFALSESEIREITESVPEAAIVDGSGPSSADLAAILPRVDVLLGRGDASTISVEELHQMTRLKWIHSWAAGPNELLFKELVESPVVVTSSAGSGAVGMAEHTIMVMLMLNSGALGWLAAQAGREWVRGVHPELRGKTCGIIGFGHLGEQLAVRLAAFGTTVLAVRRNRRPSAHVAELMPRDRLPELLGRSDFVVVTAPLTPETRGMLGDAEFRRMKPSAYFICASRGGIADETALLHALQEGRIAGAALDAFAQEPLPTDSPLWNAPNTIITPHIGAQTPARRRASLDMFIANLRAYANGGTLTNIVDKEAGY